MQWLIERFNTEPQRIAFIHDGREVGYGEVVALIDDFYKLVQDAGIKRLLSRSVLYDHGAQQQR